MSARSRAQEKDLPRRFFRAAERWQEVVTVTDEAVWRSTPLKVAMRGFSGVSASSKLPVKVPLLTKQLHLPFAAVGCRRGRD
jgi:hypothetical protein